MVRFGAGDRVFLTGFIDALKAISKIEFSPRISVQIDRREAEVLLRVLGIKDNDEETHS